MWRAERACGEQFEVCELALCVVHGAWCMVCGAWCMLRWAWRRVREAWCMVQGAGCRVLVHGAWCMVHGACAYIYIYIYLVAHTHVIMYCSFGNSSVHASALVIFHPSPHTHVAIHLFMLGRQFRSAPGDKLG